MVSFHNGCMGMDQVHRRVRRRISGMSGISEWLGVHRAAVPALVVLLVIVVVWTVGAYGGLGYLRDASSPMAILGGLYLMLAGMGVSVVIAVVAVNYLIGHFSQSREPLDRP